MKTAPLWVYVVPIILGLFYIYKSISLLELLFTPLIVIISWVVCYNSWYMDKRRGEL